MSTEAPEQQGPHRTVARILVADAPPPTGQPVTRRPDDIAAPIVLHRFEGLLVFLVAWLFFAAVGYHAVVDQHIVPGDALDLMGRAYYVWHNDPAKLAAIGFSAPPLQTIGLMPFAVLKPMASSLVALPIASGFWGALALLLIHRTLARCSFGTWRRLVSTILIAINPLWLFYASTGMPDMIYLAALAATVYFVFTWVIEDQPRFVAGVGLCMALLAMGRFGFIIWALVVAVVVAVTLAARDADKDESEGLLITLLAPLAAILFIWMLACLMIADDPFGWITDAQQPFGGTSASIDQQAVSIAGLAENGAWVLVGGSLTTVLAFLGLLWGAFTKNDRVAAGMTFIIVGGVAVMLGGAAVHDDLSLLSLRSALPLTVFGIGATAWLARSQGPLGHAMALVSLVVAIPAAAVAMDRYPYQNLEQAFARGIVQQESQEGKASRGGYRVGIKADQRMAAFIKVVAGKQRNVVLADNSIVGSVILLTGRPEAFVDRVDHGDGAFLKVLRKPWGKVRYILATKDGSDGANSVNVSFPGATAGTVSGLRRAFTSGRFVLLSVSATDPAIARRRAEAQLANPTTASPGSTGSTGTTPSVTP